MNSSQFHIVGIWRFFFHQKLLPSPSCPLFVHTANRSYIFALMRSASVQQMIRRRFRCLVQRPRLHRHMNGKRCTFKTRVYTTRIQKSSSRHSFWLYCGLIYFTTSQALCIPPAVHLQHRICIVSILHNCGVDHFYRGFCRRPAAILLLLRANGWLTPANRKYPWRGGFGICFVVSFHDRD